jgi:predicted TPR repeat methyltransferase
MPAGDDSPVSRQDVEALLAARRELGQDYDAALVDSFAERVERAVAERVDEQVALRREAQSERARTGGRQLTLGIVSLGCGIPITAIAASLADLPGLAIAWVGIVGVNAAHALSSRPRRDEPRHRP